MVARQFQVGGVYHIFNRGVDKRTIFEKNQDYSRFVLGLYIFNDKEPQYDIWTNLKFRKDKTLAIIGLPGNPMQGESAFQRKPLVELLAFTLMPNHYHFILREIEEGGISKFMQKMGGYSKYFNKQYDRSGALFQGPYKAVPIKDEFQLVNIFSYVHTNPVELIEPEWKNFIVRDKKKTLKYLESYRWSSYRDYIGKETFQDVTERGFYLEVLNGKDGCQQTVEDWIDLKSENADLSQFADYNRKSYIGSPGDPM